MCNVCTCVTGKPAGTMSENAGIEGKGLPAPEVKENRESITRNLEVNVVRTPQYERGYLRENVTR